MIFPLVGVILGLFLVLAYFARRNVTWTKQTGTSGSLGMGAFVLLIGLGIGWGLDYYIDWSIIPTYMWAAGGVLQMVGMLFYAALGLLCLSMLYSAYKCGQMVA